MPCCASARELFECIQAGNVRGAARIIESEVRWRDGLDMYSGTICADGVHRTPFLAACTEHEASLARLLVERGANPHLPSGDGGKAVHEAVRVLPELAFDSGLLLETIEYLVGDLGMRPSAGDFVRAALSASGMPAGHLRRLFSLLLPEDDADGARAAFAFLEELVSEGGGNPLFSKFTPDRRNNVLAGRLFASCRLANSGVSPESLRSAFGEEARVESRGADPGAAERREIAEAVTARLAHAFPLPNAPVERNVGEAREAVAEMRRQRVYPERLWV